MKLLTRLLLVLLVLTLIGLGLRAILQPPFKVFMDNGSITLKKYTGSDKVVTIPGMINGMLVTVIGQMAFDHNTKLVSVTIPNAVTSIESCAFSGCSSLTSITIGTNVTSIKNDAFAFCPSLNNIVIPKSVTTIWDEAFVEDTGLAAIIVDTNNPAFTSVAGVLFNKNQTKLIQYPASLTGSYVIPDSVSSIGHMAFICSRLTSVTIPNGVTNIEDGAFWVCTNLTSITIPKSVTHIGTAAFVGNTSRRDVYFQGNAPSIRDDWGLEQSVFNGADTTAYYMPVTTGWGATFGGRPTVLWKQ